MKATTHTLWTFVVTTIALFMVVLDNLVVSTAIPAIRLDLDASLEQLEWTVNAFTLAFAVFLLTGAALGDRFGRKRMFMLGVGIFTAASAAAALAPSADWLIAARAVQGLGAAIVTPLTLTILSDAVSRERRGAALGAWSGIAGLAVAMGPLVGGAVVDGIAWQWIFWLNVPVGLVLLPLATQLRESHGPDKTLDLPGLGLASAGMLGLVWGVIPTGTVTAGRARVSSVPSPAGPRCSERSLPGSFARRSRCCRCASSATAPSQQRTAHPSSCTSGCSARSSCSCSSSRPHRATRLSRPASSLLPWTAMELIVAPIAGALSNRSAAGRCSPRGSPCRRSGSDGWPRSRRQPSATGRSSGRSSSPESGWRCFSRRSRTSSSRPCGRRRRGSPPVRTTRSAKSAACSALPCWPRSSPARGGYETPEAFTDGLVSALWAGAAVVGVSAALALLIPRRRRLEEATAAEPDQLVPQAEAA